MNKLTGNIVEINSSENLSLVMINIENEQLMAIMIGRPEKVSYLRKGSKIELLFNESEVSIGKNINGQISMNNQLPCTIDTMVAAEIFTRVVLQFKNYQLSSLITTKSAKRLKLQNGDKVIALIKTNEIFLKEPD